MRRNAVRTKKEVQKKWHLPGHRSEAREAALWLNAVPIPSLGRNLDNESLRISVGDWERNSICFIIVCGIAVDDCIIHGLDCRKASENTSAIPL